MAVATAQRPGAARLPPRRRGARRAGGRRCARRSPEAAATPESISEAEAVLLRAAAAAGGRSAASASAGAEAEVARALETLVQSGGVSRPTESAVIEGEWELVYTTKSRFDLANPLGSRTDGSAPGLEALFRAAASLLGAPAPGDGSAAAGSPGGAPASSSPVQRALTAVPFVDVVQEIDLGVATRTARRGWRCDQFVRSKDGGFELQLVASADVVDADARRIDFTFEEGIIRLRGAPLVGDVTLPYPVPFKLLGDEAKGWLETLYLSEALRISLGNKGTTFVLVKRAAT